MQKCRYLLNVIFTNIANYSIKKPLNFDITSWSSILLYWKDYITHTLSSLVPRLSLSLSLSLHLYGFWTHACTVKTPLDLSCIIMSIKVNTLMYTLGRGWFWERLAVRLLSLLSLSFSLHLLIIQIDQALYVWSNGDIH